MKQQKKKTIDVKEQLLCSALELFTRKGYTATSVREIVSLAGVTKPALYYHFKNKEEIYLNLIGRFFAKIESLFVDVAKAQPSIKDQLFDLCDRVLLLFAENKDLARLIHAIYYGPPQGAPFFDFKSYHINILRHIRRIIRCGIQKGEFRNGNADDMAWAFLGAGQVAVEEQLSAGKARIDREKLRRILNVIFVGIAVENSLPKGKS